MQRFQGYIPQQRADTGLQWSPMAPQIPTEVRGALAQAKRVLGIVMRLKTSKILFNEPVDPIALGLDDYLDKVSKPMDFGTIMSRLQEGEKAGWKKCHYLKTEDVLRDVQLVFDNCFAYNDGPGDDLTRELCSEVKANFEKRWREASLPLDSAVEGSQAPSVPAETEPSEWMAESDVPAELSYVQEDLPLPVRHLDAFQLCQVGDLATMEPLEDVDGVSESIVAQGQVIPADAIAADGASQSIHIRTGPLLSWALDYAGTLSVLVQTETAWYRLHSPAPFYAGTYTSVQQKVEMCAVAHDVARKRKKLSPAAAAQEAATELGLAEDDEDIVFAEAQLLALAEISTASKGKDKKAAKAPAEGGRGRKRKASADPGDDADAGGRPALLVPGPPSMQAAAAKQLENAGEEEEEAAEEADDGDAESGGEEAPANEEEGAMEDEEEEEEDQPKRKRRRRKRKRVIVPDDDDVPMTRKEKLAMWRARRLAAQAAEKEAADAERQAEAAERAKHDRVAAEQRGPAPEPARSFRLPQQLVPDLLVLWELLQTLAPTLQTPYVPLWRFEAALCPGPIKEGVPAVPELAQSPEETPAEPAAAEPEPEPEPEQATESKQKEDEKPVPPVKLRIKMGRGRKPKVHAVVEAASPALAAPVAFVQPTDDAGVASGLVLRELHAAILRGIDGRGGLGSIGAEALRTAKLALSESQAAVDWTRRVSRLILDSPPFAVDDDARAAALHLSYAEYDSLSTLERMAILRGLCGLLLSTDAVREVVGARMDAIAALQPKPKKDDEDEKEDTQGEEQKAEGSEAEEKAAPAPAPPAKKKSGKDFSKAAGNTPGSVEEWDKWAEACRAGVRQPLGVDYQGRAYWALGSRAGAWRIYVEEPQEDPASSLWGFYEGDKIVELVAWLEKGEISAEEDLLEALAAAPLPRKGASAASKSASAAGDKEAPPILSAPELEARRWDGYRGMVAPQLLGSWNWPGASLQAGYETRMRAAIDAMLCRLPFWYSGEDIQKTSLGVYEAMAAAASPSDLARVLPLLEKLLCQAGLMRATWAQHWQHSWQRATSYCVDWKHALLLTASLQDQLRPDRNALSRPAFSRMAHDERCQLYFPLHGDQVVLLRTGVLVHIKKYMQTLGLLPLDIPEKPQEAAQADDANSEGEDQPADTGDEDGDAEEEPVQAVLQLPQQLDLPEKVRRGLKRQWDTLQDTVQQLRPIERFRVVGVAFRRSFLDGSSEVKFLDDLAADELQLGLALWPCAWILMEPSRKGPPFQTPHSPIAVPIRIDQALPDFLVRSDAFDKGMHRIWNAGDRFRMYFGGRAGSKSGGVYYRGQVAQVFDQQPDIEASEEQQEQYDPWEAVEVVWDGGKSSSGYGGRVEAVNPWELEVDPDFERTEDEIKRDQEAEQRALRAAALAMRREEEDRAEAARKEAEKEAAERAATQAAAERLRGSALRRAPSTPGDSGSDAAPLYMPSRPAAGGHGAVPADVLDMLRSLGEERFMALLANWHRGVHGKFKVPVFAHQELDLFKVFWSVMEKGGYEIVSANKQWKEVCRCLDLDLTGQTSASFNMRQNYERCLFEFEDYLASGAYVADVNAGRAPSADAVVPFHCRHPVAQLPAPGEAPKRVLLPEREPSEPRERPIPTREGSSRRRKYRDIDDIDGDDVVYDDEDDEEDFLPEESPQPTRRQGKGAHGGKGAKTFGPAMHAAGRALIGKLVLRYWEDQGGWWEALVGDYLIKSGKHRLIYDAGGEDESFETADLRTLTDDEIKPHSQHPLPGLSKVLALPAPAQPKAQLAAPAVPAVPGATPDQSAAMTAIVTALRKGISAEDLTGMVDAAATALEAAAGEQDSAKASPTVLLIAPAALKAEASTPVAAPLNAATAQEGSDREPGASGAEDASGRRSGRLSVKIRLKSAAQPSASPGAAGVGDRRVRKRRLGSPGPAAVEAEGADAQQPERKRHRLATTSCSTSPMSEAPEEEAGHANGLPAQTEVEPGSAAANLRDGQTDDSSPELAPAQLKDPPTDSLTDNDPQIDDATLPGSSTVAEDAALASVIDTGPSGSAVDPSQEVKAADGDGAPDLAAEQEGKSHGTEALEALSDAAETERLQPVIDVEMHEALDNGDSLAAHSDPAEDCEAQDTDVIRMVQPGPATDERAAELLDSNAADQDASTAADDAQPESEVPGLQPSKPEGQSTQKPVQEQSRGSDENGGV